eukprot:7330890-Pyramimonas_sp.AAC.1
MGGERRPLLIAASGVAQGCPLSGTIWAVVFGPIIIAISRELNATQRGPISACADDLGIILARLADISALASQMFAAETLAGLQLQAKKCIAAPTWALPSQDLVAEMRRVLAAAHAP